MLESKVKIPRSGLHTVNGKKGNLQNALYNVFFFFFLINFKKGLKSNLVLLK